MSEALLIGHNSEKSVVSWGPFSSSLYCPVKIHPNLELNRYKPGDSSIFSDVIKS